MEGGSKGCSERFTERARQVVVLAQDEARATQAQHIGTNTSCSACCLREEEGLAARVLESLDITVEEVRAQVARIVGQGDEVTTGQIPFTPRAKKGVGAGCAERSPSAATTSAPAHPARPRARENEVAAAHPARLRRRRREDSQ